MKASKFIFTFIFLVTLNFSLNAQNRSILTWEVLKYDIDATLPQNYSGTRDLEVKATLSLKNISSQPANRLTLRISDQAEVASVSVGGATVDFNKGDESIDGNQQLQKIASRIPAVAANGTFNVTVNYKLKVPENSGLVALSPVGSQFLPLSYWYPTPTSWYFTGGGDYAPYNLKVNGNGDLQAISAGNATADGFDQKLFGQPFFVTGNWEVSNISNVEVYTPKGMQTNREVSQKIAELADAAKNYMAGKLGKSFNPPLRIVAARRGSGFSEAGTILIDESVFQRTKLDSQTAVSITEAVVKTWFGNVVKIQEPGYGVIKEGLAKYSGRTK